MTEMPESAGQIPAWTLGWRMQRALAHAGISVNEIAEEMGVSRATISRWINDKGAPPRAAYLKQWALRTGVPYLWLTDMDPTGRGGQMIKATQKAQVTPGFRNKRTTTFRNTLAALPAVDHSRLTAVSQPFLRVRSGR